MHVDTKVWTSASSQFSDILKNLAQAYGSKIELNFILLFFNMHIILFPFLFFLNWLCNCSLLIWHFLDQTEAAVITEKTEETTIVTSETVEDEPKKERVVKHKYAHNFNL